MKIEAIKPSVRRRYEFVEFQLMWQGAIGRKLLQKKFEISPQQATLDLTSYLDMAPKNMFYDHRKRTYVPLPSFRPTFLGGEASEYLLHLEMLHHGYRSIDEIWPTSVPNFDAVTVTSRKVSPIVLKTVLSAIREQQCVEISYVSLSSQSDNARLLCPHAIASDGHRWHIRAYDVDNDRYSDFVLSRIEKIRKARSSDANVPDDKAWNTFVDLRLKPDPALTKRQKEQLQIEYEMQNGQLTIPVRKAMLFYYLRFYGFNPYDLDGKCFRNKSSFHLSVSNLKEIERYLDRRK